MPKAGTANKAFFKVQARITKRISPLLHAHLDEMADSDASASMITRRLAEEALLLRNHPLIAALQRVDFTDEFRKLSHTTMGGGMRHIAEPSHTGHDEVKKVTPIKEPSKAPPQAEAPSKEAAPSGSRSMAALIAQRGQAGQARPR